MQIEKFGNDLGLFEEPFATLCVGTSFITLGRGGGPREKSFQNSVGNAQIFTSTLGIIYFFNEFDLIRPYRSLGVGTSHVVGSVKRKTQSFSPDCQNALSLRTKSLALFLSNCRGRRLAT